MISGMEELREILTGGQSFSWTDEGDCFSATLNEKVYRVRSAEDFEADPFLHEYFDLDYDYDKARREIAAKDEVLAGAVKAFPTLRILRQDPWIALISFILSQNNNIKRITGLYGRLCRAYGHEVEKGYWSFPTPQELSRTSMAELRELKVGFRDSYIMDAIDKADILTEIPALDDHDAEARLMSIRGIGKKVANCVLLVGFHRMDAFPIDVWIRKILDRYYPGKGVEYFDPYRALCQQYLFSYARFLDLE